MKMKCEHLRILDFLL